ncbi:membrane protein of unknown function [Candidatus Promineifilum breve]|uniref:Cyclic nucleotide-binding domain-containing protein n=1 Tax=Candidatus Promineifilum breve TaxID=1806508 RepID=A0A160T105_9CHLR|nr:cyclic nucleotide-binding domain-containing protein [Candidatus Promineifilum breve]CUS03194.2 membrane protein of unknown function [Candidatus Promineifilum breve]
MSDKSEFLSELPLFTNLSEAAIDAIAGITKEYAFDSGAVIAYQRDIAGQFYIVKEGRLFTIAIDNNGITRGSKSYFPGQYFNEMWLLVPGVHPATIKGGEAGRLYVIEGSDFVQLLKRFPAIIDALAPYEDDDDTHYGLSDEAWLEAQKLKLRPRRVTTSAGGALLPEERLELFTRRSWWYLLGLLLLPFSLLIIAIVVVIVTPTDTGLEVSVKYGLPIILILISLIIALLRLIDFRADYFLITNRHLTHHEFELRHFRIQLVKVPIGQIQTVEIVKPSFLANMFNIGTARVTTAAIAGVILFDNIDNPVVVKNILERLIGQYKTQESAQTQAVMRQALEKHFGVGSPLTPTETPAAPAPRPRSPEGFFAGLSKRYGWRVIEGNTITYRKSLFVLLKQVSLPLLVFVGLGVALAGAIYAEITPWVVAILIGVGALANLGWFVWQLENWRNDIFQLSDRFVLDVDRKPFGFGESRKQAAISNIQNVDASRPGFLPTLFNYGFVSIDTAGSKSDIVFDYVPNPELIQSDIFQRIDESRRQQRVQEGSTRRQEYALLLDVYRQAMEQQRIPRRTPTDFEET